ncbi:helix-turn-helix domain-containing protein [Actinomadura opuntiae]|uniref:helix-turn-helix domain-containing protein n=1 Tax=Actinomadura sp. OS1-43 TaxID=604315 RepID=UPI00255A9BCD|nr:helix-turn-helix transcriptional regulator [Actinomadura sp. OS1-43]MDL4820293.1 helix-turn-helix transcriptional regulator [Actinomadura sp. OS1-43]
MRNISEEAVERVIENMYLNLGEQLTIDDMARTALFSKFHFSRIFRQVTGVSPGRFLSALRLQEAKRLLISTTLTVADISNRVGYTSVGTFSSRFKSSVGLAPSLYRQNRGVRARIPTDPRRNDWGTRSVSVAGHILPPEDGTAGTVFVGLFPEPIPQGSPIRCTVLNGPGRYRLPRVPQGTWYVLAHSLPDGHDPLPADPFTADPVPWVGSHGPISIAADTLPPSVDVRLRPMRVIDPPVLLALTDIRANALNATAG